MAAWARVMRRVPSAVWQAMQVAAFSWPLAGSALAGAAAVLAAAGRAIKADTDQDSDRANSNFGNCIFERIFECIFK